MIETKGDPLPRLWFCPGPRGQMGKYYCMDEFHKCDGCGEPLAGMMVVEKQYGLYNPQKAKHKKGKNQNTIEVRLFCRNCAGQAKRHRPYAEYIIVLLTPTVPMQATQMFLRPADWANTKGELTIAEAATTAVHASKTINRCRLGGRAGTGKDPDYRPFDMKLIEEKDQELNLKDGLNHLDSLFAAKPAIAHEETKKLENQQNFR